MMLKYDPDVIVGHDFIGAQLETLLQRLKELKIEHWSRICRLRRSKSISLGRQGTNVKLMTGRLVCDLASDAAKVCGFLVFDHLIHSSSSPVHFLSSN